MCLAVAAPLIGGVISGIGAASQANAAAASSEANAKLKERQAQIDTQTAGYKVERQTDQINRVTGSQRAGFAANGIALTGSAADTVNESQQEGALDVAAIRWNSALNADNLKYEAKIDKMNASAERTAGTIGFISPVISGAGSAFAKYQSSFG